jgi:hypothetical protein
VNNRYKGSLNKCYYALNVDIRVEHDSHHNDYVDNLFTRITPSCAPTRPNKMI